MRRQLNSEKTTCIHNDTNTLGQICDCSPSSWTLPSYKSMTHTNKCVIIILILLSMTVYYMYMLKAFKQLHLQLSHNYRVPPDDESKGGGTDH